jgi:hypothetical protein
VLRVSAAYADILEAAGESALAAEWHAAVAAHTPDESDVEFSEEELPVVDVAPAVEAAEAPVDGAPSDADDDSGGDDSGGDDAGSDDDGDGSGAYDFHEDVEAEVAELLGETDEPEDAAAAEAAAEH